MDGLSVTHPEPKLELVLLVWGLDNRCVLVLHYQPASATLDDDKCPDASRHSTLHSVGRSEGTGGAGNSCNCHILTRKSLGGIETDLDGRALAPGGEPIPGLYAAGEASGFGGGGVHGYRALEGTFLGGCLFSGRTAGRAAAAAV